VEQRVDHDVAHEDDLRLGLALGRSVASASRDGVSSSSASRSVTRRLISSGMVRSPLRSPASTCAVRTPSFAATTLAASVEFTSP
jgi:hypothetical protein